MIIIVKLCDDIIIVIIIMLNLFLVVQIFPKLEWHFDDLKTCPPRFRHCIRLDNVMCLFDFTSDQRIPEPTLDLLKMKFAICVSHISASPSEWYCMHVTLGWDAKIASA
jgi:hypothetical protein